MAKSHNKVFSMIDWAVERLVGESRSQMQPEVRLCYEQIVLALKDATFNQPIDPTASRRMHSYWRTGQRNKNSAIFFLSSDADLEYFCSPLGIEIDVIREMHEILQDTDRVSALIEAHLNETRRRHVSSCAA